MIYQKSFSVVKCVCFAFVAICFLASCQDEEIAAAPTNSESAAVSDGESNIASLTITGENTEFSETVNCSSCTYVVDKNSEVVDGNELGLKPGSVICLNSAVKYGNLSFINVHGTTENPIIIANTIVTN